ncbi:MULTISPECIES: ABC transporter permease [unclassified Kaistella]|uniref:ABC transporter permease n=1 Tax=unclassified Kaistella TaxID=2762626 RepID=UPI002732A35D|nr:MULTISPECIES: ABC transporter permease [unclassified Kaistella]MDP2453528.1 ABC transporter permease [Kaistella sp. SH11-4b]MDP2456585.1 ABC transporter permease [Kaistella sp. SH40-3]MDP2459341.1 ABC transporter permease [Kaistella sp. SH19-2b]
MKQLITFVKKEFWHVLRDKRTLLVLFGMPVVQVLLFGFALSTEVKNTKIGVLDQDKSQNSIELISKIKANQYFDVDKNLKSIDEAEDAFKGGKIKMILVIPAQFSQDINSGKKAQLQLITDGTDINLANQIYNFMSNIIIDFYGQKTLQPKSGVQPEIRMLYNPQLKGAPNFVPGVMALILLIICVLMTAIAIVREKEMGTLEVLLVSPMKPYIIILAKAIPYFILSMIILVSILILSVTVLDLPIKGSLLLLFGISIIFIITNLLLGIVISIVTDSQQTAMLIALVGTMLPTIMLSGFMFPVENMPLPLQMIGNVIPAKWYYEIVKNIMIKGTGLEVIWKHVLVLIGMMMVLFVIAVKKFKIRLE